MTQILIILIAFTIIPIMVKYGQKLSWAIMGTALTLAILSGIGLETFRGIMMDLFIDKGNLDTILTVAMVGVLGGLMRHYNLLDRIVEVMLSIINNKKKILMILPPMMGMLTIPGGAALSAPFLNDLGEDLDIPRPTRAAINLTFRHISIFILAYNPSFLVIKTILPEVNIYKLIFLNLMLVVAILTTAYFLYVRDIETENIPRQDKIGKNLLKLIVLTSPIYSSVIINAMTGLPFYISMLSSIIIVYFLSNKKNFLNRLVKSISIDSIITVTGVLILKGIILNMAQLLVFIENIFAQVNNQILILGIFMLVAIFFGLISGNSSMPLAVTLPILSLMSLPSNMLYTYLFFIYGSGFIGYYFSPIHLCQILTIEEMGVSTLEIYREYKLYAPILLGILGIATFGLSIIL